ncbi:MAG TPA: glutathione S-transferase family protein [Thiobacillaceae bacterium]|nr:glutathione S-transferase family protein [Thiobacillaceae bacterium]
MSDLTLVIGNKNYSSWSLRPWLVLRCSGIPFREIRVPLYRPESAPALADLSPSGLVPVLHDGDVRIWDSLAICEYLHERFPEHRLWPDDMRARAVARSVSAEMHAGFSGLRQAMCMNVRGQFPDQGRTPQSLRDIDRVLSIWTDCRARFGSGGGFLFGRFGIADAMYAPVVLRFQTYAVALSGAALDYANAVLALPALGEWVAAARAESERIEKFDLYG